MIDPSLLQSLEGQQYCVLRPRGEVEQYYDEVQSVLKNRLPASVTYPNVGHVTLRGFGDPEHVAELGSFLDAWAESVDPLEIRVEAIDSFPAPYKIVILRLAKTEELKRAYSLLSEELAKSTLMPIGEQFSVDDWTFHMSVAYCNTLSDEEWTDLVNELGGFASETPATVVSDAELVWYDGGEHSRTVPLGGSVTRQ